METSESAAKPETTAESAAELGARLRHARERQAIGLEEVSAELRIGPHFLGAIEEGRFEALGPAVFAKGYLKQYGAKLGLNVAELAAAYDRAVGQPSVDLAPSRTIKLRDDRQIAVWVVAALALAAVAFVLWFWWIRFASDAPASTTAGIAAAREESLGEAAPTASAGRVEAAAATNATAVDDVPTADASAANAPPGNAPTANAPTANALAALDDTNAGDSAGRGRAAAPRATDAPIVERPAAASSPARAETPPAPAGTPPAPAGTPTTAPATPGPALELRFVEDSWAEVTDDRGERLYYALGRAGTSERIPADRELHFLFGNAHGVELEFAGRSIPIPGSHERGDVAQFDLDALTE